MCLKRDATMIPVFRRLTYLAMRLSVNGDISAMREILPNLAPSLATGEKKDRIAPRQPSEKSYSLEPWTSFLSPPTPLEMMSTREWCVASLTPPTMGSRIESHQFADCLPCRSTAELTNLAQQGTSLPNFSNLLWLTTRVLKGRDLGPLNDPHYLVGIWVV